MARVRLPLIGLLALSSAGANCEDPPDGPGTITLTWGLDWGDGGELTGCEGTPADRVTVALTQGDSSLEVGSFACGTGGGTTNDEVPVGSHDVVVALHVRGGQEIVSVVVNDVTVTAGADTDLGRIVFEIPPEDCVAEGDEDIDGRADCEDLECASAAECESAVEEDCGAEGDEDEDGDADCDDEDCAGDPACEEEVCTPAAVTIAAIYTRGGAGGASYNGDFVVLENRTGADYDLTGHSLQTATILLSSWDVFALPAESIPPNGAYLVAIGTPGSQGADVPAPDESFAGAGNLNDTAQLSIALMPTDDALTACPTTAIDLFSAGEVACAEGTTVAPPGTDGATEWYARGGDGCADSDDNATDFAVATAGTPRNSGSAPVDCTCPSR